MEVYRQYYRKTGNNKFVDMKNVFILMSFISVLVSCSELQYKEQEQNDSVNGICFGLDKRSDWKTKVVLSDNEQNGFDVKWTESDKIGIYAVGDDASGNNYPYIAKSANLSHTAFYPSTNLVYSWEKYNNAEFYAYFPYGGVSGEGVVGSVDVSLTDNQIQNVSDMYSSITDLLFFKSAPSKANEDGIVNFYFYNVFSIVQMNFNVIQNSSLDIPIKKVELKSSDNVLASDNVKIDLTKGIGNSYNSLIDKVSEGKKEISLTFDDEFTLLRGKDNYVNMVVLPGKHENIKIYITAIDNSVAEYDMYSADFKSNRVYRKNIQIDPADFIPAEPFDCSVLSSECNVGEPVEFFITGNSDKIDFYSGSFGNDYKYAETDRIINPAMNLSFETYANSGSGNPLSLSVMVSNDFSGEYTEESIMAASWIDLSNMFTFPAAVGDRVGSGQYDIFGALASDKEFYLAYRYFVKGNSLSRTKLFVNNFKIVKTGVGVDDEELYSHKNADWQLVLFSGYDGVTSTNSPQVTETSIQFTSELKPVSDREAWAVSGKLLKAEKINLGHDAPIHIKTAEQEQISSYSYVFDEPGEYIVVVVSTSKTLMGERIEKKEFKISVK